MEDSIPRTPRRPARRAGRQAGYAARLLRHRPDPHRLEGSVRAAPRRAGRGQDPGRRQAANCRCCDLLDGDASSQDFFARPRPLLLPRHPRLRLRRSERRAGRRLERPGRSRSAPGRACRPCAPTPDFEPLAASFKRIKNILRPGRSSPAAAPIDAALLEAGPGSANSTRSSARIAGQPIESVISRLRPKVDLFFDKVLVNAPDAAVRQNRLTLLQTLLAEFSTIADFSEIVTNS